MAERERKTPDGYDIRTVPAGGLDGAAYAECVAIIKTGGAVDVHYAKQELPLARCLAMVRSGDKIIGVGAIKRIRHDYASRIAERARANFPSNTPELGYVAVHPEHRGHGLSHRIVTELLAKHVKHEGPLFATTSSPQMKRTLIKAGFAQTGSQWNGRAGALSLWLKE